MIRQLHEDDRAAAIALLHREPAFNLYFLGNIEVNGFAQDFCQFWGDFGPDGALYAVLNRYMKGWVIYGLPEADWAGLGAIVDNHPGGADRLQDNPGGVDSFLPYLQRYRARKLGEQELVVLDAVDFCPAAPGPNVAVRKATLDDLPALIDFYAHAEEMSRVPEAVERPLRDRRIWLAEMEGAIRSAALTNAETRDQAMIGGVYTKPDARGRGLSQAVVSALCAELIGLAKQPVLYWENPAAGAVYHKLGFHAVGIWRSVRLAEGMNSQGNSITCP